MNQIVAPVIRFGSAAEAIGVTKKTLRNWMARGQVQLEEASEGWQTFSLLDLANLTITAELVRYGCGVLPAFMTARGLVGSATHLLAQYKNTPPGVMRHAFKGWALLAHKSETSWHFQQSAPSTEVTDWVHPSTLMIHADILIEQMLDRLDGALNDGGDDE